MAVNVGRDERELSHLLEAEWDPIGVYDGPRVDWAPPGEYDLYATEILGLLSQRRSVESVAAYLRDTARREIGIEPTGSERGVAERIVAWYRSRDGGSSGR